MYWSGYDVKTPRDRFVSWDSYSKIIDMQKLLLQTAGKKAILWKRYDKGVKCPCAKGGLPMSPHSICYGLGIVGGYYQYGNREVYLYRDGNSIKLWDAYNGVESVYSIVNNSVETGWLNGYCFVGSMLSVKANKDNVVGVFISFDGVNWIDCVQNVVFLTGQDFKIRLDNIITNFEIVRLRIPVLSRNWWYFSENPPLRMEQLFRWGIDTVPFDVRVWTITDEGDGLLLKTGDILYWLEGYYSGIRYSVVNNRVTQFIKEKDVGVPDVSSSGLLTQVIGMRKIKNSEQDFYVW